MKDHLKNPQIHKSTLEEIFEISVYLYENIILRKYNFVYEILIMLENFLDCEISPNQHILAVLI